MSEIFVGILQRLPELEAWLDAEADFWSALGDWEFKVLVGRWKSTFEDIVRRGQARSRGRRAVEWLEARFPADLVLFSGLRLDRLANLGGLGPAAYSAEGLRRLPADLANRLELIVGPQDLAWSCVFCHEAGGLGHECLLRDYDERPSSL